MEIFTIGHSVLANTEFENLLKQNNIDILIDVRSVPYSKQCPQFNRDFLPARMKQTGIRYGYMGNTLGARYSQKELLFDNGQVNFLSVRKSKEFNNSIQRLMNEIKDYKICLMCSEADPLSCHRFGLIAADLTEKEVDVKHIYQDKVLEQNILENMLICKFKKKIDTLMSNESPLAQAYKLLNYEIGFKN